MGDFNRDYYRLDTDRERLLHNALQKVLAFDDAHWSEMAAINSAEYKLYRAIRVARWALEAVELDLDTQGAK